VVLTTGVEVVVVVEESGLVVTTGGVVVVVVVTELAGAGEVGGREVTICESGSEAQPARRPRAPQQARRGVSCLTARAEAERDRMFSIGLIMPLHYTRHGSGDMGCSRQSIRWIIFDRGSGELAVLGWSGLSPRRSGRVEVNALHPGKCYEKRQGATAGRAEKILFVTYYVTSPLPF
jgi:hypothetical protein